MFTRRASDEAWIKYLLNSELLTVDQLQIMRGNQNQIDITELLVKHADKFPTDLWLNRALQQDRFHYIPPAAIEPGEIHALKEMQPLLTAKCMNDRILPLGLSHQILYLGILRYDPEFPELAEILASVPSEIHICLVPVAPGQFQELFSRLRGIIQ